LQQIFTTDYNNVKFAHTFYCDDQCQTVSGQQLIFLKFKTKIKIRKKTGLQIRQIRICEKVTESVGFEIRFEIPSHPYLKM